MHGYRKLTQNDGTPVLVNMGAVTSVQPSPDNGSLIRFATSEDPVAVKESVEAIFYSVEAKNIPSHG
jgi:hypothetical protein